VAPRYLRVRTETVSGGWRVVIGPGRRLGDVLIAVLALPILVFVASFLACAPGLIASERRPPLWALIFVMFCLLGMGVLAAFFALNLLWKLFGREEIQRTDRTVVITTLLFGFRRSRSYSAPLMTNVRVQERHYRAKGHPMVGRTVVFDYDGKQVSTTSQLSDEDCEVLLQGPLRELIEPRSPDGSLSAS
jgi:hypothetical protein